MSKIFKSKLFHGFTLHEINHFFRKYPTLTQAYKKDEVIFRHDQDCQCIGLVVDGIVDIQDICGEGTVSLITRIRAGEIFGEVLLYSHQQTFPATLVASTDVTILFIDRDVLVKALGEHKKLLVNFLTLIADRTLDLHRRVKVITKHSLKSKLAAYILSNSKGEDKVPIGMTKEKLADYLSVKRPSLSRELILMKQEGLIDYDRNYFYIVDREELESI
ncbi:Crp/Fnr family transcriptional regulator [Mycoplasmatota bacterium WC44]